MYGQLTSEAPLPPAATVLLPAKAWSSNYTARPRDEVALGLRCLSEADALTCEAEAAKEATAGGRSAEEAPERFNEALMVWAVASALCDPNDARKAYFEFGDADVRRAFPPETLKHLFHELELAHLASSPVRPEASEEDLLDLADRLTDPEPFARLTPARAARLRRLLRFCLDELSEP